MIYFKNIDEFAQAAYASFNAQSYSDCSIYYCEHPKGVYFCVKLVPHRKEGSEKETRGSVENEIEVLRAIKTKIIDAGSCPHFCEILGATTIDSFDLIGKFKTRCAEVMKDTTKVINGPVDRLCFLRADIDVNKQFLPRFSLVFLEDIELPLEEIFLHHSLPRRNFARLIFDRIFFQIVWSLALINKVFPGFRHNDLGLHNIRIMVAPGDLFTSRAYDYEMNGRKWRIPYRGYVVKIIDFGFSEVPSEGIQPPNKIWTIDSHNVSDIAYFLWSIRQWCVANKSLLSGGAVWASFLSWIPGFSEKTSWALFMSETTRDITPDDILFRSKIFEEYEKFAEENEWTVIRTFRAPKN